MYHRSDVRVSAELHFPAQRWTLNARRLAVRLRTLLEPLAVSTLLDKQGVLPISGTCTHRLGKLDSWYQEPGTTKSIVELANLVLTGKPCGFYRLARRHNSGNAFRGQLRVERYFNPSDKVQWTIQAALSEPITTTVDPAFRLSEDDGWPNVEGRIALGLGPIEMVGLAAKRPLELGISGVIGQIRTTPLPPGSPNDRVVADVWGLGTDFRWKITECFGVMGEFYTGETLGTYNGGILQNINAVTLQGIRATGGWMELFTYWTPCLHSHIGYGIDKAKEADVASDVAAAGRTRNSTTFGNLLWDVNPVFRIGFELTWRDTDFKSPLLADNDGVGFHTQLQWAF